MTYEVVTSNSYRKSLKRVSKHKYFDSILVNKVISLLAEGKPLHERYKDHQLIGSLKEFRECHIKNDLLLVYQKQDDVLILLLVDIGTHSSLFG